MNELVEKSFSASLVIEAEKRIEEINESMNRNKCMNLHAPWFGSIIPVIMNSFNFEFYSLNKPKVDKVLATISEIFDELNLEEEHQYRVALKECFRYLAENIVSFHYFINDKNIPVLLNSSEVTKIKTKGDKMIIESNKEGVITVYITSTANYKKIKDLHEIITAKDTYVATRDVMWCVLNKRYIKDDEGNIKTTMITVNKKNGDEINVSSIRRIFKVTVDKLTNMELIIEIFRLEGGVRHEIN